MTMLPANADRSGRWARLLERLRGARWVLAAAGAMLLFLAASGRISFYELLVGCAVVVLAVLLAPAGPGPTLPDTAARPEAMQIEPAFAVLIEALPDAAYLLDRRGSVLAGNARAAALHGLVRRGELASLRIRTPEVVEAIRLTGADAVPRRVEYSVRVPTERRLEAHVVPVSLASEREPDHILLEFRDLSQQHLVEQMRADFVANASHELRTPLASLSGFIDTLRGSARGDEAARERFLSIMADQAKRMSRLIDDLLSLSRVEMNEHIQPKTIVDLVPIVDHVRDALTPLARERGVTVEVKRAVDQLPVQGDRDELIRLFENLVENALKYGASGKRVEIGLAAEGGEAVVAVRDFGPGIAPEHLPRLTERFYRVDVETSRAQGGTGLGLAIVKHILARHRGKLGVESDLGHGAIFTVRIDRAETENPIAVRA
jgi:two-component system phosphate regulon sensor histidine kinase PhoR